MKPWSEGRKVSTLLSLMIVLVAAPARAEDHEHHPRGWARVQGWAADVDHDDGGELRSGGSLRSRLDLTEHLRLDLAYARTLDGYGQGQDFGYAQVAWHGLRVGGGTVGDDWAAHIGAAPRFGVDVARWLRLEGGADAALGVGWLDERERERGAPDDERTAWDDAGRGGIDVYALSTAADLTVRLRPHEVVELAVGAYVDAFMALGRPGQADPLPAALERFSKKTDLGVSATLSQGSVGAHGTASARLFHDVCAHGKRSQAWLRYREAWDWIHLDPVYTLIAETRPFDDVRVARVPWRTTRTLELEVSRELGDGGQVVAAVDVRHVDGSTTVQDFADRDGWSAGARLSGRYGRVFGSTGVRWHLRPSELEPLLGPVPRAQVTGQLGVLLVTSPEADVAIEAGFEHGRQDDWGVPRAGWAGWGAVTVTFGGARDLLHEDLIDRPLRLPPLPRRGPPATGRVAVRELWTTSGARVGGAVPTGAPDAGSGAPAGGGAAANDRSATAPPPAHAYAVPEQHSHAARHLGDLLGLEPEDVVGLEQAGRDSGLLDGQVEISELDSFLDRNPELAERFEASLPGVRDLLGQVLSVQSGELSGDALLRQQGAVLFSGYGTNDAGIGVSWKERLTVSRTYTFHRPRSGSESASRVQAALASDDQDGERPDLFGEGVTFRTGTPLDLARHNRWQKLTLALPDGDRYRVAFQGSTGWTRSMRLLLSGR